MFLLTTKFVKSCIPPRARNLYYCLDYMTHIHNFLTLILCIILMKYMLLLVNRKMANLFAFHFSGRKQKLIRTFKNEIRVYPKVCGRLSIMGHLHTYTKSD